MATQLLTVGAQQALIVPQTTLIQSPSVTGAVQGLTCNSLITTATYTLGPSGAASFPFDNPLISSSTTVSGIIVDSSSADGNPALSLSGQSTGSIWVTVTNEAGVPMNGFLDIGLLVFQSV